MMHDYPTGIVSISSKPAQFSIYPNPASNQIIIALSVAPSVGDAALYDACGRVVFRTALTGAKTGLDISSLPAGMYVYRMTIEGIQAMGKLIKE